MAKKKKRGLKIRFQRSSLLTKLMVLLVVVASVVILVSQQSQIRANEAKLNDLTNRAAQLQEENQALQSDIEDLDSDESIKKIAREKLGLVGSGEVIFSDVGE